MERGHITTDEQDPKSILSQKEVVGIIKFWQGLQGSLIPFGNILINIKG